MPMFTELHKGESIRIGDTIITMVRIGKSKSRLAIDAKSSVKIEHVDKSSPKTEQEA